MATNFIKRSETDSFSINGLELAKGEEVDWNLTQGLTIFWCQRVMDDFHYPSKVYFRLSPIPPSPSLTAPPAIRHVSLAIPWISAHLRGSFLHFYSVASLWFCTLSLTNLRLSLTWLTGNRNAFFCNLTFEMHCKTYLRTGAWWWCVSQFDTSMKVPRVIRYI